MDNLDNLCNQLCFCNHDNLSTPSSLLIAQMTLRCMQIAFKQQIRQIPDSVPFSYSSNGHYTVSAFLHGNSEMVSNELVPAVKRPSSRDDEFLSVCYQFGLM